MSDANQITLRHTLATLAYRAGRALRNAPPQFAEFAGAGTDRTPVRILAHIGDLLDWALSMVNGATVWNTSVPLPWNEEVNRFFAALDTLDGRLASNEPIACPPDRLFQGPIADALTHVGQIAMLRRLAGARIGGENYFVAEIREGRVGKDQAAPLREFE